MATALIVMTIATRLSAMDLYQGIEAHMRSHDDCALPPGNTDTKPGQQHDFVPAGHVLRWRYGNGLCRFNNSSTSMSVSSAPRKQMTSTMDTSIPSVLSTTPILANRSRYREANKRLHRGIQHRSGSITVTLVNSGLRADTRSLNQVKFFNNVSGFPPVEPGHVRRQAPWTHGHSPTVFVSTLLSC